MQRPLQRMSFHWLQETFCQSFQRLWLILPTSEPEFGLLYPFYGSCWLYLQNLLLQIQKKINECWCLSTWVIRIYALSQTQRNQILAEEGGFPALSQLDRGGLWVYMAFLQPEADSVPSNAKKNNSARKQIPINFYIISKGNISQVLGNLKG